MIETVVSPQNKVIKLAVSLKMKKYRDESGLFFVEGIRMAEEALQSFWPIEACIFSTQAEQDFRVRSVLSLMQKRESRIIKVPDSLYGKITDTEHPQGIMIILKRKRFNIDDLLANQDKPVLLVVLDGIQEPGNVGTIVRTADAAGCTGIILTEGCSDIYAAKTVRSSMGSIFHLPVVEDVDRVRLLSVLKGKGITLMATALDCATTYCEADFTKAVAVIFGNEGKGVSPELLQNSSVRLNIPIYGKAESLNVSASAAVILYEAVKQRHLML